MRNTKITRFACLLLASLFLVSAAVVGVGASASSNANVTDKSIGDYVDVLNTISYEEYQKLHKGYFQPETPLGTVGQTFSATSDWKFVDQKGNTIEIDGDSWKLTTAQGTVYHSLDDAVTNGNFKKADLVYVDTFDGQSALYTPDIGTVTWTLDFASKGVTTGGLYSIELVYYPVAGKDASAEREFAVGGEVPFSEARNLALAKIWSSYQIDRDTGNVKILTATVKFGGKVDRAKLLLDAEAAGMAYAITADDSAVVFEQPMVITQKRSEFIEKYGLRFYIVDDNNNELRPTQEQTPQWTSYTFRDSDGYYSNHFGFVLKPENGKVELSLKGINEALAIKEIVLKPYSTLTSYADYLADITDSVGTAEGQDVILIQGESTTHTSTNVVYPVQDSTSAATSPTAADRVMLNTIGGEKWETTGQWIEYQFSVASSGMYDIYTRFKQSYLDGMYVCRSMQLFTPEYASAEAYSTKIGDTAGYYNGFPFAEATELRYNYATNWQVEKLNSGADLNQDGVADSYQLYFEKDVVYTIRFEVTLGSKNDLVQDIESILNALNNDYLEIIKLTGTTPDEYRDYSFTRLLPKVMVDFVDQSAALKEVSKFLKTTAGVSSTYTGICDKLIDLLDSMVRDEDSIAKNLSTFKSYVGSLGTFLTDAKTQPLQIDYICIQPSTATVPQAEKNFFQSFWFECERFIQSFFRDYNSMGAINDGGDEVTNTISVWLPYGRDQANVLRNLTTNDFTPEHKIAVDLKLVNGGTLLPSILAGMGPDAYMGLDQGTVVNYAIRGALANIETMEHDSVEAFEEEMHAIFNQAAMQVLGIEDADGDMHYYGLPETQDFVMMFVRMDLLADLGIEIPKTWDELYNAQSALESNNMEIGVNTNYQIFLYQMGGNLFADNGMRINLDSKTGLEAFEKMCDMFTQYSFPYTYDAANRFRTGEMPIIIAGYTGLYNQLKVFATEIEGCWSFVPLPGIQDPVTGKINNQSISACTAVVMINGTDNVDGAWKFMKWQTGDNCQVDYASEMVAIIGDSAKHSTANRKALESMPWTRDEYEEVSKQYENLASVPNYPGTYIIGRYTNFAFLSAYNDDANPRTELLRYIKTINTEITRKREEFKLETLAIGSTLAEKRTAQIMAAIDALSKINETKYAKLIEDVKFAVVNEKIDQIYTAKAGFDAVLLADWEAAGSPTMQITKVNGETITVPTYYKNVSKQTAEERDGGYAIEDLNEQQLVFFIADALQDTAEALATYED